MSRAQSVKNPAPKKSAAKSNAKSNAKSSAEKGGRPRYEVNYKQLETLCRMQCTGEECAGVLSVDYDTLNAALKRDGHGGFSDFFKKTSAGGKMSLRRLQWDAARRGNISMLIWLGKQYLNQTDKTEKPEDQDEVPPLDIRFNVRAPVADVRVTVGENKAAKGDA